MRSRKLDLEGMSIDDLLNLRERVDEQIAAAAEGEVAALKDKMAVLQPYVRNRSKSTKTRRKADARSGRVPAKFRDPATGKTWSGRGMTPVWLREYEEQGRKREEFAV